MDRETLEHIFEPFFTTKGVGEGTGLGLATVYGIATQNNGFVTVVSEPENGTVFSIYLPRHPEDVSPEVVGAAASLTGTGTILLVEDEVMLLWTATRLLEEIGYTVIQAAAPEEAIAVCERPDQRIDLILTDVVMPGMNGREMVGRIRLIRPEIKVLFMSGYSSDIMAKQGIMEEGLHFVPKPLDMFQLNEMITELLKNG